MELLDRVFPLDQADIELGDRYVTHGFRGVYLLLKERAGVEWQCDDPYLRQAVSEMFGISPGDLWP